jgi:hypothetical protein
MATVIERADRFAELYPELSAQAHINNVYNEKYRPEQKTIFDNFYIGGAHTKTSINIWSMESAVESGKLVSNLILKKYGLKEALLVTHQSAEFIKKIQNIDDILYTNNLPNIIDVVLIIFFIIFLIVFLRHF